MRAFSLDVRAYISIYMFIRDIQGDMAYIRAFGIDWGLWDGILCRRAYDRNTLSHHCELTRSSFQRLGRMHKQAFSA